jgi:hypothetical protein
MKVEKNKKIIGSDSAALDCNQSESRHFAKIFTPDGTDGTGEGRDASPRRPRAVRLADSKSGYVPANSLSVKSAKSVVHRLCVRKAALGCNHSESRSFARIFSPRSLRLCAHLGKRGIWLRRAALRILRLFATNQLNLLSMNSLHTKSAFFNRAKSCQIVPNRAIFLNRHARNSNTPLFLGLRRCLALALAVLGINYLATAGGLPASTPASVVRDEAAGQHLANEIRSSMPAENMERSGVLVIKSGKNKTQIPVRCQVKLHDATWETDYQAADTPAAGAERLIIIHSTNGPSQYLYARAPKPGAALPEPAPLSPGQLDAPFAGSDFSLSDLGLEFLHWPGQCQLLPGEMRKGQPCYLLESANSRKEGIARVKSSIDKESLGPIYAEAYDAEGKKIKEFSLDSMKKDARGRYNVKEMEIDNIKLNSTTGLIFDIPKSQ